MKRSRRIRRRSSVLLVGLAASLAVSGCTPAHYREQADKAAYDIIAAGQRQALGREESFTIERASDTLRRRLLSVQNLPVSGPASLGVERLDPPPHWPEPSDRQEALEDVRPDAGTAGAVVVLSLTEALQVAARNSRDYQTSKEEVFAAALDLDLERNDFRYLFAGTPSGTYTFDPGDTTNVQGLEGTASASVGRRLKQGAALTARLFLDVARLLTQDRSSSLGIQADATISIPLLRGAGEHIVTEPLTQAQREVIYSLYALERSRRILAVRVASGYLDVLQQLDQVRNAEENYRSLMAGARRARRLADAGRLPEIQVDQARQDELRARNRWISVRQTHAQRVDAFKVTLGLPTDADVELNRGELDRLADAARALAATQPTATMPAISSPAGARDADEPIALTHPDAQGGPYELPPDEAVVTALGRRLDLRTAQGRVFDAQRGVVVAADALKAGLTLVGTAQAGARRGLSAADEPNAQFRPDTGLYTAGLLLDLPLERTAERNAYRNSLISLRRAVRSVQELEDQVKLQVRDALRTLVEARESARIQALAVTLARRRVASTELFLQAGRAEIRDVLEAREDLVSAQDALSAALVNYRVAELELQRDMGVLEIDQKGLWREYQPEQRTE